MAKRNKLEIIHDILRIIQNHHNAIKYTPLLRKSNISTKRFQEYFSDLENKRLIIKRKNSNDDNIVALTEKGFRFIEKYKTIINFIDEFEL